MISFADIINDVKKGALTVGDFISHAIRLGVAIKQMWQECGPQTLAVASQVLYDVVKSATLAEQAAQAGTAGSWMGAVTLSQQTIAAVNQLVADFKKGEAQIVQDFKVLKYDFANPTN